MSSAPAIHEPNTGAPGAIAIGPRAAAVAFLHAATLADSAGAREFFRRRAVKLLLSLGREGKRRHAAEDSRPDDDSTTPRRLGLVGIFTGGDPVADRVIAVDDPLDGSTVSSFDTLAFDSALNNRGQLAFIVGLADSRTGIYRADPRARDDVMH